MPKIKSSKVALFLNTCSGAVDVPVTKTAVINASGNAVLNSGNNFYTTDYFPVVNGATIKIYGKQANETSGGVSFNSVNYIAFYDKDKNVIESLRTQGSSSKMRSLGNGVYTYLVSSSHASADEIRYCRVSYWRGLNIPLSITVTDWNRMGKGIVTLPLSYGTKSTTETWVSEDNATTTVDGYEIAVDVEHVAMKGEPVFDYVDNIRKGLLTGSDCETEALVLPIYDFSETGDGLEGTAQKFGATVSVTDYELNGGEIAKIKYKVAFNGDPQNVTLTIADGKIQPSAEIGTASVDDGEIIIEEEPPEDDGDNED